MLEDKDIVFQLARKNGIKERMIVDFKKIFLKSMRKTTDYQCTELLCALRMIGLPCNKCRDKQYIIDYIKNHRDIIQCEDTIIEKYLNDLEMSIGKKTLGKDYLNNIHDPGWFNKIKRIYLTGKTYRNYKEIVELNKEHAKVKPNSDIYILLNDDQWIGLSCKQSCNCPCTNKVVEGSNKELKECRERLLNECGITINNYREHRGPGGKISEVFYNRRCINEGMCEYWELLEEHIIKNKEYFINGVKNSMCQGECLPYMVYEYDGKEFINTKDREMDIKKCDIRVSNIFCWGKRKERNASKIWFDFIWPLNH